MNFIDTNIMKIKFEREFNGNRQIFLPSGKISAVIFFFCFNPKANPRIEKIQQYLFSLTLFS